MGVTLPESAEAPTTGVLTTATELQVTLTDVSSSTGTSTPLDLWVDSIAPVISIAAPTNICGSFHQAFATYDTDVSFATDTPKVTATITTGSSTDTLTSPTFAAGTATFSNVAFDVGQSNMTAVATDAAGNTTALQPAPCTVTVGMAPVVLFNTPQSTNELCASTGTGANCIDDADPMMPGWQGSISVQALVGGVAAPGGITFFVNGLQVGTEQAVDNLGNATLSNVTLLDGNVTITAQTDNIAGNGVGSATEMVVVDLGAPNPVTDLTPSVFDRRQTTMRLNWTAPSDFGGGSIAGYQIRYAKVPITAGNFDDTTVTTAVTYSGTPQPTGMPDQIDVPNLYIENGYFFAIEAVDAAGNRSSIDATTTALAAHFNATTLTGTSGLSNEETGVSVDGTGDANCDQISDIVAGSFNSGSVYIYFGSAAFMAEAPSVTITGTTTSFGRSVAYVGDVNAALVNNLPTEDIAVGDPVRNEVFIYKARTTWPSMLTEGDADFVISTDSSYAGSAFGGSISRLGDFDGDGFDDFVVTSSNLAIGASTLVGRVTIIRGGTTFSSTTVSATTPNPARAIIINGDTNLTRPVFGTHAVGMGRFYAGAGNTLVVSASGLTAAGVASNNEGHIYAFHGQSGTGGFIDIASADAVVAGAAATMRIGVALANLGPILGGLPLVGSGNLVDTISVPGASGTTFLYSGDATVGPFASKQIFDDLSDSNTGVAVMGGGISGRNLSFSLIGGSTPDLVILAKTASFVNIIDGSTLGSLGTPFNAANSTVNVPLPMGWDLTAPAATIVPDINGDSATDFVITDSVTAVPGKVVVFW